MIARPDELANARDVERDEQKRSNIRRGITSAVSIGTGLGAAGAAEKILPFLSKYIPVDLAMKGINKVSPKIGEFLQRGQKAGLDVKEGLDFVKSQFTSALEPFKEIRSIIEQYSPELHQFLDQEIKKGRDVMQAGALAQNDKRFMKIIDKIQKDHKTPWSAILQSVFGGGPGQSIQLPEEGTPVKDMLAQGNPFPQQGQQQQGGQGPVGNRLQQALQLLKQSRGG